MTSAVDVNLDSFLLAHPWVFVAVVFVFAFAVMWQEIKEDLRR